MNLLQLLRFLDGPLAKKITDLPENHPVRHEFELHKGKLMIQLGTEIGANVDQPQDDWLPFVFARENLTRPFSQAAIQLWDELFEFARSTKVPAERSRK